MSRYAAGCLTSAGSTTLPIFSLYASASVTPYISEIGIFNVSNTAVALRLVRLTTAGTRPTLLTPGILRGHDTAAALSSASGTHTAAPTLGQDLGYRCVLGAAQGSATIWTFDDMELTIPAVANAGIGIVVENGTGQACQVYMKWAE